MKTEFDLIINASLSDVWKTFVDVDQRTRWQQAFLSYVQVSGTVGQPGSVGELTLVEKDRRRVLTETITERREETFLAATYTSAESSSLFVHKFEAVVENQTCWRSWSNFRFHGIAKVTAFFTAGAIKSRIEGDMQRFKLLLESDLAGANQ